MAANPLFESAWQDNASFLREEGEECSEQELLLCMQEQLADAQSENARLRMQLETMRSLLDSAQAQLLLASEQQHAAARAASEGGSDADAEEAELLASAAAAADEPPAKRFKVSREVLERWEFYRLHKDDPEIVGPLRSKLNSIGVDRVPWQMVKSACDDVMRRREKKNAAAAQ